MNKLLSLLFLLSCITQTSIAQPYGNEWVEYDKTYFKFNVIQTGLYRVPHSTLVQYIDANDLVGNNFKLITKGKEIPIYVSNNGLFGSSDYIEFYGEHNDGKLDTLLFKDGWHAQPYYSLFNDNASYFLTIDAIGTNRRFNTQTNDPTGLTAEDYFWHKSFSFFNGTYNNGQMIASGSLAVLRDSHFGHAEGWIGSSFNGPATRNRTVNTPSVYRNIPTLEAKLKHVHVTQSFTFNHEIVIGIGNSSFTNNHLGYQVRELNENIPISDVANGTTTVSFRENNEQPVADAYIELTYPRQFNFGAEQLYKFPIAQTNATLLEITGFINGPSPVIYDFENDERYEGIVTGSRVDFGLQNVSNERELLYINGTSTTNIEEMDTVEFVDFSIIQNQGNFIILSHKALRESSDNVNYLEEYANHRASINGGSYTPIVTYIDQIENQFGYGVRNHPIAIRNFINYGLDNFSIDPEHYFVIGKGITYTLIRNNNTNFNNCKIISMGSPDSDVFLTARSAEEEIPQISIGRLSARTGDEVIMYLEKVMEYEGVYNDTSIIAQSDYDKLWMKRILHLGGGKNAIEQSNFKFFLQNYEQIAELPLFGAKVHSVFKTSTDPIQISTSQLVDSLINTGISLITFFGHSTTSTIDFDITPEEFENYGHYNTFLSNGCFVGSIFDDDQFTYSDRFIFQNRTGSIAYIAPITLAITSSLNGYTTRFYNKSMNTRYGNGLGQIMRDISEEIITDLSNLDQILSRQMILHGDPAIKLNPHNRPDYIITRRSIEYDPRIVSASRDSFDVKVAIANLGKAIDRDYTVHIRRLFPDGNFETYDKVVPATYFRDTVVFTLPTNRVSGLGINILNIKVDNGEDISELSEFNNEITDTLVIFSDDILPVLPYEFCIVNADPNPLYFSTASYNEEPKGYILQIDTTEYFNSMLMQETNISTMGGIVEWSPPVAYIENTVYYIRATLDSLIEGDYNWNYSSFLYNTELSTG